MINVQRGTAIRAKRHAINPAQSETTALSCAKVAGLDQIHGIGPVPERCARQSLSMEDPMMS
ncbi:MAG TPA: hypothetical protein VMF89_05895 [Polyangiales bacterium]|nr:hypothetical protein [Polyangiales bacterium]